MSEREAARIGDAVLSWLVKYDLADAGNEYRAEDVVAILNDIAPYEESAEITRLQKELETAREALEAVASILPKYAMKGDTASDDEALDAVLETVTDALKGEEVAGCGNNVDSNP